MPKEVSHSAASFLHSLHLELSAFPLVVQLPLPLRKPLNTSF